MCSASCLQAVLLGGTGRACVGYVAVAVRSPHPATLPACPPRTQAGFITGAAAAFAESPIDFYKSQIQVQIIRAKSDPAYKREWRLGRRCGVGVSHARDQTHQLPLGLHAGTVAGGCSSRQQGPCVLPSPPPAAAPYTNVLDCVKSTLRISGARGPFQVGGVVERAGSAWWQMRLSGGMPGVAEILGCGVFALQRGETQACGQKLTSQPALPTVCRACPPRCCVTRPPTRSTSAPLRCVGVAECSGG